MEVDSSSAADAGKDEAAAAVKATAAAAAAAAAATEAAVAAVAEAALPEVEVYLSTLALTTLLRHKADGDAVAVAPRLLERTVSFNRRWVAGERGRGGGAERGEAEGGTRGGRRKKKRGGCCCRCCFCILWQMPKGKNEA